MDRTKKDVQFNLRVDEDLIGKIDKVRVREDRTRSSMFRILVIEALEQREKFTDRIITK